MRTITVNDMYMALQKACKDGLGFKKILLSNDDEGNGYHECFYTISQTKDNVFESGLPHGISMEDAEENYVILG